jgi:hypothetical protein
MIPRILPAVIVALAILGLGLEVRLDLSAQVDAVLSKLDHASQSTGGQPSRLARIVQGVTQSAISGVANGFKQQAGIASGGPDRQGREEFDAVRAIRVTDVAILRDQTGTQERIIGIVHNDGNRVVRNVQFNTKLRDADGRLIDVVPTFASGFLLPGKDLGFVAYRNPGSPGRPAAARAEVAVTEAVVVPAGDPAQRN